MIQVTRWDGTRIHLNADWIQSIETTPDTLITLTTGFKLLVRDKPEMILEAFRKYRETTSTRMPLPLKEHVPLKEHE